MVDLYVKKFVEMIKSNVNDDDCLEKIINKIYEDGFYDGNQSLIED